MVGTLKYSRLAIDESQIESVQLMGAPTARREPPRPPVSAHVHSKAEFSRTRTPMRSSRPPPTSFPSGLPAAQPTTSAQMKVLMSEIVFKPPQRPPPQPPAAIAGAAPLTAPPAKFAPPSYKQPPEPVRIKDRFLVESVHGGAGALPGRVQADAGMLLDNGHHICRDHVLGRALFRHGYVACIAHCSLLTLTARGILIVPSSNEHFSCGTSHLQQMGSTLSLLEVASLATVESHMQISLTR